MTHHLATHTHTHGTLSLTLALSRRELNETGSTLPAEDTHCQTVRWMEGETLHVRKIRNDTKIEMLTTLAACSEIIYQIVDFRIGSHKERPDRKY